MKKRFLSLVLAVTLGFALIPAAAAVETASNDAFTLTNVIRLYFERNSSGPGVYNERIFFASEGAAIQFSFPLISWYRMDLNIDDETEWPDWNAELEWESYMAWINAICDRTTEESDGFYNYNDTFMDIPSVELKANSYYQFTMAYDYDWQGYDEPVPFDYVVTVYVLDDKIAAQIPPSTPASSSSNAPSAWAVQEVEAAIGAGLVPENLQKNYQSDIARGEAAEMFVGLIEKTSGMPIDRFMAEKGVAINSNAFTDTNNPAVLAANALGIMRGTSENVFSSDETLQRAQIAALICRVANVLDVDTNNYTHAFDDVVGHWVEAEIGWPVHMEIIRGVSSAKFEPDAKLTTEEAIVITYRALESLS